MEYLARPEIRARLGGIRCNLRLTCDILRCIFAGGYSMGGTGGGEKDRICGKSSISNISAAFNLYLFQQSVTTQ